MNVERRKIMKEIDQIHQYERHARSYYSRTTSVCTHYGIFVLACVGMLSTSSVGALSLSSLSTSSVTDIVDDFNKPLSLSSSSSSILSRGLQSGSSKFSPSYSRTLQQLPTQPANGSTVSVNPGSTSQGVVRIICGRDNSITDRLGRRWAGDTNRTFLTPLLMSNTSNYTGHKYNTCSQRMTLFANTTMSELLCSERYFNPPNDNLLNKTIGYNIAIPVPSSQPSSAGIGTTTVVTIDCVVQLHFAELYQTQIGQRVFDVLINDQIIVSNLDILSNTNGLRYVPYLFNSSTISLSRSYNASNSNSSLPAILTLGFRSKTNHPKINAIEIIWNATTRTTSSSSSTTTTIPTIAPISTPVLVPVSIPTTNAPIVGVTTATPSKAVPIAKPTSFPVSIPSKAPTSKPSFAPSINPTAKVPVAKATSSPKSTSIPVSSPTSKPSIAPSINPTAKVTVAKPTSSPKSTSIPVSSPTMAPMSKPSINPTAKPTIAKPTSSPLSPKGTAKPLSSPTMVPKGSQTTPVTSPPFPPVRINAGGPTVTDSIGRTWVSDMNFDDQNSTVQIPNATGATYSICSWTPVLENRIYQPSKLPGSVACSERYFNPWAHPGPYRYQIAMKMSTSSSASFITNTSVAAASNVTKKFNVTLHFVEIYHTSVGKRIFDVDISPGGVNAAALTNIDIVGRTSSIEQYSLLSISTTVQIMNCHSIDGCIVTIDLKPNVDYPKITAIEIIDITSSSNTTSSSNSTPSPSLTPTFSSTVAPTKKLQVPSKTKSPSATLSLAPVPIASNKFQPIRINVGGATSIIDKFNNTWITDTNSQYHSPGGLSYDACAAGIATPSSFVSNSSDIDTTSGLFCSERYFNQWVQTNPADGPLSYNISIAQANSTALYNVRLLFAENYFTETGKRVFDVYVQGKIVLSDFDIVQTTGSKFHVYDVTVSGPVRPTSGLLNSNDYTISIVFVPIIENPKLSAIEITEYVPSVPETIPTVAPTSKVTPAIQPTVKPVAYAPSAAPKSSTSPVQQPVISTVAPTKLLPTSSPTVANTTNVTLTFQPILINCGNTLSDYIDWKGQVWKSEKASSNNPIYHNDAGFTYGNQWKSISNTQSPELYQTERFGIFKYEIPVEEANYEVIIHFAEIFHTEVGSRVFNVKVEERLFKNVDIIALAGTYDKAVTLETAQLVSDGSLTIEFSQGLKDAPKVSAIEIKLVGPHYAHAVVNGPYKAVDMTGAGMGFVNIDGGESHTHLPGAKLNQFLWKKGSVLLSNKTVDTISLPTGEHSLSLTVIDDHGYEATELTTINVFPFGYPAVSSIEPNSGSIQGGDVIVIRGSGFDTGGSNDVKVHFGIRVLDGSDIEIIDNFTIRVPSCPPHILGAPVSVAVETPLATSNTVAYTYVAGSPILFSESVLIASKSPTVAKFGPDRKLYVGSDDGLLSKYTLDDTYTSVIAVVSSYVYQYRAILGIAFDPMEVETDNPAVYITHSFFFHYEWKSTSGYAVNGKVSIVRGANLDMTEDIITGLPVSDHDHGLNAIEFGDEGEIYFGAGSNTNGGVPGQLTHFQLQKEMGLTAAVLVANLADPDFNGFIKYDQPDDGNIIQGSVEVFSSGLRNPFGIVLHSNGYMYVSDSGPNYGYGDMMTGCGPDDFISDAQESDELCLIEKGKFYGHPNAHRGKTDPRQCKWRSNMEPSDSEYTSSIVNMPSAMGGVTEFTSNHFNGQLRHNLIVCKYTDGLFRIVLTPDGREVVPESDPILLLQGDSGLDITQAPNGVLVQTRLPLEDLALFVPIEVDNGQLEVKSVFPRRGGEAGGSKLDIYGTNFDIGGSNSTLSVILGGSNCPITSMSSTKIVCTIPGGTKGTVNLTVTNGNYSSNFDRAYRYITGMPQNLTRL